MHLCFCVHSICIYICTCTNVYIMYMYIYIYFGIDPHFTIYITALCVYIHIYSYIQGCADLKI